MVTVTECVAGSYVAVSIAWCCGARWFGQLAMSRLPCWYSAGAEVSGLPQLAGSSVDLVELSTMQAVPDDAEHLVFESQIMS